MTLVDMNEAAAAAEAFACGCRASLGRREGRFSANQLRQLMLEELHRRNFADTTTLSSQGGQKHS
jgi:hypothetical protein